MTLDALFRDILRNEIRAAVREELQAQRPVVAADELVSITQAAATVGFGPKWITQRLNSGELKRYGEGRGTRVSIAEVRQLLEPRAPTPGSDEAVDEKANAIMKRFR